MCIELNKHNYNSHDLKIYVYTIVPCLAVHLKSTLIILIWSSILIKKKKKKKTFNNQGYKLEDRELRIKNKDSESGIKNWGLRALLYVCLGHIQ